MENCKTSLLKDMRRAKRDRLAYLALAIENTKESIEAL